MSYKAVGDVSRLGSGSMSDSALCPAGPSKAMNTGCEHRVCATRPDPAAYKAERALREQHQFIPETPSVLCESRQLLLINLTMVRSIYNIP